MMLDLPSDAFDPIRSCHGPTQCGFSAGKHRVPLGDVAPYAAWPWPIHCLLTASRLTLLHVAPSDRRGGEGPVKALTPKQCIGFAPALSCGSLVWL